MSTDTVAATQELLELNAQLFESLGRGDKQIHIHFSKFWKLENSLFEILEILRDGFTKFAGRDVISKSDYGVTITLVT